MDRGVISTANELFEARHYPSVVAVVTDALEGEPEHVPLLLLRARAHIALRRDLEAQADLRDIIRLDPQCSAAFRLLGTLAARRDEHDSAAIFFREALRLDPSDREASDWLAIVGRSSRPARNVPAPAAAAGPFSGHRTLPITERSTRSLSSPARAEQRPGSQPRFARGTQTPADGQPQLARGSEPKESPIWKTPAPLPPAPTAQRLAAYLPTPAPLKTTVPGQMPPRRPLAAPPRPLTRGPTPELPGFGEYLVASGILSRERLRAAQAYQRSMKVQLSTAIVTLGLATPQRIEWAAVSHQAQLARPQQP